MNYTEQQLGEMPNWIKIQKDTFILPDYVDTQVNVDCFSDEQKLCYDIITSHNSDTNTSKEPLLLIINGVGGTGKSYLIRAVKNCLGSKCAVTATTGKAAFNVNGVTVHSLLKLPIGPSSHKDLKGESLAALQENLSTVKYIIIDEYSMLGQTTMGWIDRRCREVLGKKNKYLVKCQLF